MSHCQRLVERGLLKHLSTPRRNRPPGGMIWKPRKSCQPPSRCGMLDNPTLSLVDPWGCDVARAKRGKRRRRRDRRFSATPIQNKVIKCTRKTVCVGCLFLRTPSRAPYRTPSACANRAAYPDPPPVVPDPESIDARASYRGRHSTIARLSPARIVSRHWGPPRACQRVPCCE